MTGTLMPAVSVATPAFLIALEAGFSQRQYRIVAAETVIGRDGQHCGLVCAGETVSRSHARLLLRIDGSCWLEDLHSTNGVFVNGQRLSAAHCLREGDLIGLGRALPQLRFQQHSSRDPLHLRLPARDHWVIGRDSGCDLPLLGESTVSGRHALLTVKGGRLHLVDQQSLNGTWVNGCSRRRAVLAPQDVVLIGSSELRFQLTTTGELAVTQRQCGQSVHLECVHLSRRAKGQGGESRLLLDDITLAIAAGEFVGILGPSGAGKTTLLTTLAGAVKPQQGSVLVNETVLAKSSAMFRNTVGYVPQEDILHGELSVAASFDYIARLRLSPDLGREQRAAIVDSTIETLGLQQVRHLPVGRLSGGQRKRVSLGAELLVRPGLLLLDEPTAGLDAATEQQMMRHFRRMADQGTTVVVTTHLLANLDLLDKIAICAQGQLVFFGPPGDALRFFGTAERPLAAWPELFSLLSGEASGDEVQDPAAIARQWRSRYDHSPMYDLHVQQRLSTTALALITQKQAGSAQQDRWAGLWPRLSTALRGALFETLPAASLRSCAILARRHLHLRLACWQKTLLLLLVPVVLALATLSQPVAGLPSDGEVQARQTEINQVLVQGGPLLERQLRLLLAPTTSDTRSAGQLLHALRYEGPAHLPLPLGSLVMMVMSAVFCGTLIACLEIASEGSIYRRERLSHLRLLPYLSSKIPFCFVLTALQCLLFAGLCQMQPIFRLINFWPPVLVMVAVAWSSVALGLLLSASDSSGGRFAVMAAVAVVLPQLLLSGGIGPDFYRGMSLPMQWLADLLPARWGLEMLCTAVFGNLPGEGAQWVSGFVHEGIGFDFGTGVYYTGGLILAGQFVSWLLLGAGVLFLRDSRRW